MCATRDAYTLAGINSADAGRGYPAEHAAEGAKTRHGRRKIVAILRICNKTKQDKLFAMLATPSREVASREPRHG